MLMVPFLFGAFCLSTRELLALAFVVLIAHAGVIVLLVHERPGTVRLSVELLQWVLVAAVLCWFAVMVGYISALRGRLGERKRAAEAAHLATSRVLTNAQRLTRIGHWEWNVLDRQLSCSEEIHRICGWIAGDASPEPRSFLTVINPEDHEAVKQCVAELTHGKPSGLDFRIVLPDGSERVVRGQGEVSADEAGHVTRLAGTVQDITERRRAEEQIRYLSLYDALTGLPKREWLKEIFGHARARAKRYGGLMAVLCLDLDGFTWVNNTLGHDAGDRLLQEVAHRLRSCLRGSDGLGINAPAQVGNDVARLGGDEFTVLLVEIGHVHNVNKVARRVLDAIALPFTSNGHEITVTASMGIAIYPTDGTDFDVLLKNADSALHHAREAGQNTSQFYTHSMNATALERLDLENALRKALERDEFELHYQPKVDLNTGEISGVEALIRWRHPEFGPVSPGRFIPIAEDTGLIVPIGEWVLKTACAQAKAWHTAGYPHLSMAVNVSARQFRRQNIPHLVSRILTETGLNSQRLELELTESLLMHDAEDVVQTLRQLKAPGVTLSLDDFGTGYSSLSYLKRFPIDSVKIDQSFIRDVTDNADDAAIVKAIIAMARSLNIKTIAEGVETKSQLDFLIAHGCDAIQGYYFSRPLPAHDMAALLRAETRIPVETRGRELTTRTLSLVG